MAASFDFTIVTQTDVPGISLVVAQNEDAFGYLIDEHMTILPNGASPIDSELVGDFISDCGWDKYSVELV